MAFDSFWHSVLDLVRISGPDNLIAPLEDEVWRSVTIFSEADIDSMRIKNAVEDAMSALTGNDVTEVE